MHRSIRFIALVCAAFAGVSPAPVRAAIDVVKPDLQIVSISPSPAGPNRARVVIVNAGYAPSPACMMSLTVQIPVQRLLFHTVPALPKSSGLFSPTATFDVDILTSPTTSGQILFGAVDSQAQVAESHEDNNTYWYTAP